MRIATNRARRLPRIGISRCLLGECVRYDGGHKRNLCVLEKLEGRVEFVPVCPEVECGLAVPREPMDLVGTAEAPKLVIKKTHCDLTPQMKKWIERKIAGLKKKKLRGFVFKSKSPSCGLRDARVFDGKGNLVDCGAGLFAREFIKCFPDLPVEDEAGFQVADRSSGFLRMIAGFHGRGKRQDKRGKAFPP